MYTWRINFVLAATALLAGCSGEISSPESNPPGTPGTGLPGTGSSGNGTGAGTGAGTGGGSSGSTGSGGSGAGTTTPPDVCVPGVPGTSQLPRLTRVHYDNTIRDLVGIEGNPSSMLAPDKPGSVDQPTWDGYKRAAEALATQIVTTPTARALAIPCTPSGDGAACAQQMIEQFGKRVFRRPLTAAEVTRFMGMYTNRATITPTGTFDEAAELIIRSFLISPSFLTRAEVSGVQEGERFTLSSHEIASRLSYMLWGSMPDDQLLAAADAGELATPEQILAQAQRMLGDARAHSMVQAFHEYYAHMGAGTRWETAQRDETLYATWDPAMMPMLSEETNRIVDQVVFGGGSFQDLILSPIAYVNASTAPLYGLSPASYGAELTQVTLDATQRPGVFTRAGFLTAYSLFNRPSAILRGAFIQEDVLCTEIGTPPPDAEGTPLPTEGLLTNRERTDAQTAAQACAGCHHGLINPTGYAMEAYDAIGMWQTTEKDTGAPINTVSTVPIGATTVDVTGPADLMNAIAASPEAKKCYAKKWVEFAYERTLNSADACTVDTLAQKLTGTGYTVLNLIADLTQSESFRYRALEQ